MKNIKNNKKIEDDDKKELIEYTEFVNDRLEKVGEISPHKGMKSLLRTLNKNLVDVDEKGIKNRYNKSLSRQLTLIDDYIINDDNTLKYYNRTFDRLVKRNDELISEYNKLDIAGPKKKSIRDKIDPIKDFDDPKKLLAIYYDVFQLIQILNLVTQHFKKRFRKTIQKVLKIQLIKLKKKIKEIEKRPCEAWF